MGDKTKISWAHHTFNPWWGCVKVSPGCTNCYAASFDHRLGGDHWGPRARRKFTSESYWEKPLKWNRKAQAAGERYRVFCASMADVFEVVPDDHPDREAMDAARARLWRLILATPDLDWLLLTKRPENVGRMLPWGAWSSGWINVWIGITAENQAHADRRIPLLLSFTARTRFVSYEPALGPIALSAIPGAQAIDWIIAGAESGPKRRPMRESWIRDMRDQCAAAEVAFFYKQRIRRDGKKIELPALDGRVWAEVPERHSGRRPTREGD